MALLLEWRLNSSKYRYSGKTENKRGFKLVLRGDTGAGGLVAPLLCTAYHSKLLISGHNRCRPSAFVLISPPSLTD